MILFFYKKTIMNEENFPNRIKQYSKSSNGFLQEKKIKE